MAYCLAWPPPLVLPPKIGVELNIFIEYRAYHYATAGLEILIERFAQGFLTVSVLSLLWSLYVYSQYGEENTFKDLQCI